MGNTAQFVAGAWCLDFANTVEPRSTPDREYLPDYDTLAVWCRQAGAITPRTAATLRRWATGHPDAAAQAHDDAIVLREVTYRIFAAISVGDPPGRKDLEHVRGCQADAIAHATPEWTADGLRWRWPIPASAGPRSDITQLDVPRWILADDTIRLLESPRVSRVKICRPSCAWLFLDSTRNGSRRWCATSDCGTREKIRRQAERRAVRRRLRSGGPGGP